MRTATQDNKNMKILFHHHLACTTKNSYVKFGESLPKLGLQINETLSLEVSEISSIVKGKMSLVDLVHLIPHMFLI